MSFARVLGDAIVNPPQRNSPRWWASRLVPPTVATAEFIMAVATLLRHTELGQLGQLLVATNLLDRAVSATHIDPAVTLAVLAITHIGGNRIMALLEILMRPLLDAQLEAGIELGRKEGKEEGREEGEAQGRSQANAEFEAWKERQRAAGAVFFDDDELPEDPPGHPDTDQ